MTNNAQHRLLLVESDAEDRRSLTNLLAASGFDVVSAVDYETALKTMESDIPQAAVVATRLAKGPSGFVALRAFKAKGGQIAVALLPQDNFEEAVSAFRLGAGDVLVKPPRAAEIVGILRRGLGEAPRVDRPKASEVQASDEAEAESESEEAAE